MKPHIILKDFKGSQTGHDHHEFRADKEPVPLSDDLAAIVVKEGWAKPHSKAEDRDTKVIEPEEFKDEETAKKSKKAKG